MVEKTLNILLYSYIYIYMNVNKWGNPGWKFLHTITFNYPNNPTDYDKERYTNFFTNVGQMLPCKYCRDSYNIYIKYLKIDDFLDSREGVTYWLYRLHNLVNKKIYKDNINFLDIINEYESYRAKCSNDYKDGDKKKIFKSCNKDVFDRNHNNDIFYRNTILKFKDKIDEIEKVLYKAQDNPNKLCEKYNQSNIYYIKYL